MKFWRTSPEPVPQPEPEPEAETTAPDDGEWEVHPCTLPDLSKFSSNGVSIYNKVWRCHCGRRWWLEHIEYKKMEWGHKIVGVGWTELMSAAPITEDELNSLLSEGDES